MTKDEIITAIANHISSRGGGYSKWYVGVTQDPEQRLFSDHNVKKEGGVWIYHPCGSHLVARDVEKHFLAEGCDGGTGGGDEDAKYVYAYKKTATTNP